MKSRGIWIVKWALIAFFALILLGAAALGALQLRDLWLQAGVPREVSQWDMAFDESRDRMRVQLENTYDQDVSVMQIMETVNRTGEDLSEIVLRVYANGPEMLGTGERAVDVTNVYVDDEAVSYAYDEGDTTVVRVSYPWKAGEVIELRWHSSVPLTGELTLAQLPVLGIYEDGAWRTDAWDPLVQDSYAAAFDAEIWAEYNHDVEMLFGAAVLAYAEEPSGRIMQARMLGARDVTLLVRKNGALRSREIAGVCVSAAAEGVFAAERLLAQCETALTSLADAGLVYPFKALTVVQTDTGNEDGFAASAFVALDSGLRGEEQLRALTRLIARQTFGVLVASDPWNAPWLSQTLASTAEVMAYRAREGEANYEERFFEEIEVATRLTRPYGVSVGAGIDRFGSETEMAQVLRDQGAAMMLGIEAAMGREAFVQALHAYAQENAHAIADRGALEAALEAASGSSWSGYLSDELTY